MNKIMILLGLIALSLVIVSYQAEAFNLWEFLGFEDEENKEYSYNFEVKYKCDDNELEFETIISATDEETARSELEDIYSSLDICEEFELEIELKEVVEIE